MFHANTSCTPTFVNNSRKPQSLAVRQASNLPFAQVGEPNRTQTKSARDLHRPDGWLHKDLSSPSHISYIHRSTISPSICTQQMSRTSPCATAARISKTPSNHYVSLPRPITSIAPMQLSCSPKRRQLSAFSCTVTNNSINAAAYRLHIWASAAYTRLACCSC